MPWKMGGEETNMEKLERNYILDMFKCIYAFPHERRMADGTHPNPETE